MRAPCTIILQSPLWTFKLSYFREMKTAVVSCNRRTKLTPCDSTRTSNTSRISIRWSVNGRKDGWPQLFKGHLNSKKTKRIS